MRCWTGQVLSEDDFMRYYDGLRTLIGGLPSRLESSAPFWMV